MKSFFGLFSRSRSQQVRTLLVVGKWSGSIDRIQGVFREGVVIVFHGHLIERDDIVPSSQLLLMFFNAFVRLLHELRRRLLGFSLLCIYFGRNVLRRIRDLQSRKLLIELLNETGRNPGTIISPVNGGWFLRVCKGLS